MARILLDAICSGNTSLAKDLIQDESFRGVDSQTSRRDGTALFFCCSRGYVDLALLLLAKSANVDARNKCQATPLHAAADNDHLRIVKLLLDRGANINAQTHRGDTALHLAAFRGHADVAQCLVEHGADFQLGNDSNVSAATGATVQGHVEVGQYLNAINDLYGQPKHPLNIMDSTSEGMIVLETPSLTSSINEPSYPLRHRQNSAYPGSPFAQGAYSSPPFPINNPNTSDDMVGYFETNNNNNPTTTNNNNDAFNNMGEIGTVRVQQQPRPITPQAINKSSSPSQHYVPCPNTPTSPMSVDIFPPPRRNSEINTRSTSDTTSTLISNPTSEPTLPTPMHTTSSSPPPSSSSSTTTTTSPNNSEFHPRNSNAKNCHRLSMTTTNAPAATTTPFSTDPSAHNNINNNTNNHPYQRQQQQQQASSTNHDESQSPLYYNLDAACYPRPHHQQNQQQHHHHHQHDIDHHRNCNSYNPQTHQLHRQRPQSTTPTPTNVFHLDSSNSSLFSGPSSTLIGHRSRSPPTLPKHPEENTDDSMIIYNPPSINPPNNDHPHQMSVATHRLTPTTTATTATDGHHQPQLKDIISNNPSTTLPKESLFFSLQYCDENNDMANKPSNNRLRSDVHNSVHSYVSDGASTSSITSSFSGDARRINDDFDLLPSIPLINIPQHSQQQQQKLSDNSNRFTQQPHHNRSQTSSSPTPSPFFQKNTSTTTTNPPQPHQSVYHRLPSTPSSISSIDFGDPNAQPLNFDSPSSTQVTITTTNNKNAPCHYQQQYQQQQQLQQQQYNNKIQRSYSPMNVEQLPVVESGACANDSLTGSAFRPMETSAGRRRMSVTGTDNKNGDSINDLVFNSPMSSNEYDDGSETFYQKDSTTHPRRGLVGSRNHNDYTTKSHLNSSENGMFMKSNFNGASFNTDNNSRRVTNMPGGILNDLSAVKKTRAGTCVNYLNIPVGST